jgi:hypothetical protein
MRRVGAVLFTLVLSSGAAAPAHAQASAPAATPAVPALVTPAQAAAFLGDWTIAAEGAQGPVAVALTLKTDEDKVVGELTSEAMGRQTVTDITRTSDGLLLSYSFDYQGMPVPVALTLSASAGAVKASFSFAGGAYEMTGTATKKKP